VAEVSASPKTPAYAPHAPSDLTRTQEPPTVKCRAEAVHSRSPVRILDIGKSSLFRIVCVYRRRCLGFHVTENSSTFFLPLQSVDYSSLRSEALGRRCLGQPQEQAPPDLNQDRRQLITWTQQILLILTSINNSNSNIINNININNGISNILFIVARL